MLEKAAGKRQGVQAGFVDDNHVGIPAISVGIHDGILVLVIDMSAQRRIEPRTLKNLSPLEVSSPVLGKTCVLLTGWIAFCY